MEFHELKVDPIAEEQGGDSIHIEENIKEVESEWHLFSRVFDDEEEAHDAYNSCMLAKGFGICKRETRISGTDQKEIEDAPLCNKESMIKGI